MEKDDTSLLTLTPVPPKTTGEGLPYAPIDWPSPGDAWTWKVGNRISSSGFHNDRFLIAPTRLQESSSRKIWLRSKTAARYFLQTKFPEADVDNFFASFTWEIPAEIQTIRKDRKRPLSTATSPEKVVTRRKISKRTKESTKKITMPGQFPATTDNTTSLPDVHLPNNTTPSLSQDNLISNTTDSPGDQEPITYIPTSPIIAASARPEHVLLPPDSRSLVDCLAEMTQDDFEFYLNSLDDLLSDSPTKGPARFSSGPEMDDFIIARQELSSLLAMGFSSLVCSDRLSKIMNLSSKLQLDPNLTTEELLMLNLVREIPSAGKEFLAVRRMAEQARTFFSELGAKKARIEERKKEFIQWRGKIVLLQAEEESASAVIREIDEQIGVLQARRAVMENVVEMNGKMIADLLSKNKEEFECVPRVVNEIQMANSERLMWDSRRKEAATKEKEILSKFRLLHGFSFVR